ncbi:unnamed protein product [Gadus morhua 'NCC']
MGAMNANGAVVSPKWTRVFSDSTTILCQLRDFPVECNCLEFVEWHFTLLPPLQPKVNCSTISTQSNRFPQPICTLMPKRSKCLLCGSINS